MSIERAFLNVTTADLAASRAFYERLGYTVRFESDWFVQLAVRDREGLEIGLLRRDGDVVPEAARSAPNGVLLTIVVPDVDAAHEALRAHVDVVESPRDLFYGQRRMVLRAPEGTLVDLSSECAPDPDWMKRVTPTGDGAYRESPLGEP